MKNKTPVYRQVMVLHGVDWNDKFHYSNDGFKAWAKKMYNVRVKLLEFIETGPDVHEDGTPVDGTGGRVDAFFMVHDHDLKKMFDRFEKYDNPPRWLFDVLMNNDEAGQDLYPAYVNDWDDDSFCFCEDYPIAKKLMTEEQLWFWERRN